MLQTHELLNNVNPLPPDTMEETKELVGKPPNILTEELKEYGLNEKKNIVKEQTRNRNQPYAFLGGGDIGEQLTLTMFPETVGSASKGGMAYDNKTIDKDGKVISAKEVKFVSRCGTKQCNQCKNKCPLFQSKCIYCNCKDFKYMSDSRAGISSDAHIKYKDVIKEYIIFVQDYNSDTQTITLKAYKFLSKNEYFNSYIQNQYDSGKKRGGSCNFIPYSYDWNMSGPITILIVDINITKSDPEIVYHLYNPESRIYDNVPKSALDKCLNFREKTVNLDKTRLINGCYEYEYIKNIFKLRSKTIGKSRGTTTRK